MRNIVMGSTVFVLTSLLYWSILPTKGEVRALVKLPGMWFILPLLIIIGLLVSGTLIANEMLIR
jgi:hypothetical protein